jgi:ferric-dicitrate binding protein FerR (iron transport regulator)
MTGRKGDVCRAAASLTVDETCAEQARKRAARWHAWLKSPECTFQDRENFERWCADVTNAAAYAAFCGDLTAVPELANGGEESSYAAHAFTSFVRLPRLEADQL